MAWSLVSPVKPDIVMTAVSDPHSPHHHHVAGAPGQLRSAELEQTPCEQDITYNITRHFSFQSSAPVGVRAGGGTSMKAAVTKRVKISDLSDPGKISPYG